MQNDLQKPTMQHLLIAAVFETSQKNLFKSTMHFHKRFANATLLVQIYISDKLCSHQLHSLLLPLNSVLSDI